MKALASISLIVILLLASCGAAFTKEQEGYPTFDFDTRMLIPSNGVQMLFSDENLRLPASIRTMFSLAQTIEAYAEQSMKRARYIPGIAVPQWYGGHLQYLLCSTSH